MIEFCLVWSIYIVMIIIIIYVLSSNIFIAVCIHCTVLFSCMHCVVNGLFCCNLWLTVNTYHMVHVYTTIYFWQKSVHRTIHRSAVMFLWICYILIINKVVILPVRILYCFMQCIQFHYCVYIYIYIYIIFWTVHLCQALSCSDTLVS